MCSLQNLSQDATLYTSMSSFPSPNDFLKKLLTKIYGFLNIILNFELNIHALFLYILEFSYLNLISRKRPTILT